MDSEREVTFKVDIFDRVVFPFIDELLNSQRKSREGNDIPESCLRASGLLCRAFLQYEIQPGNDYAEIEMIWMRVLDVLDVMMNQFRRHAVVRCPRF